MPTGIWAELTRKALVIGISNYAHLPDLSFCKKDGENFSDTLRTIGFEVTQANTLTGKVEYERMRDAIINFFRDANIKPKDTLLFYFSGHGVVEDSGDGYFSTYEIDPDAPYKKGIPFSFVTEMMDKSTSNRKIAVLDCCYSGLARIGAKGDSKVELNVTQLGTKAISTKFRQGDGKYILSACLGSQEAYSMTKGDNSVFTYYLLNGLKGGNGESVDKDGNVTPSTLGEYVYNSIMSLPFKERPRQKPITNVLASGEIILASYPKEAVNLRADDKLTNENYNIPYSSLNQILTYGNTEQRSKAMDTLILSDQLIRSKRHVEEVVINRKEIEIIDLHHATNRHQGNVKLLATDIAVVEAYYGLSITFDFYKNVFGRNSIDNKGMKIVLAVHYGDGWSNAVWNGSEFWFGDGDGQIFRRFTKFVDIIAYEYTKGVIQYGPSLNYEGQAGALVEHLASVFGSLVKQYDLNQTADRADWLIGAGLFYSKIKGRALRSLKEPGNAYDDPLIGRDPQVSHMKDYKKIDYDNGGVHTYSGIPNRAFYVAAAELGGYAWEKAGLIWYKALDRLTASSSFKDMAKITSELAGSLFGVGSKEQNAVLRGWDDVGLEVQ